jgi:hypothetical protein
MYEEFHVIYCDYFKRHESGEKSLRKERGQAGG